MSVLLIRLCNVIVSTDPVTLGVIGLVTAVSLRWLYLKTSRKYRLLAKIPGPVPKPIFGNAFDLKGGYDGTLEMMQVEWPKQYGGIHKWFVGNQCNVSLSSPELLESLLTSQKVLDKGTDYNWYRPWLGDGLLVSTGAKWKSRRRLITPSFHFKIMNDFMVVFNKQGRILCDVIDKRSDEERSDLDVYPLLTNCTLDIICESAMGTEINAQTDLDNEYVQSVDQMARVIVDRTTKPWLANDLIFPWTPTGREQARLLSILHAFPEKVINQRRKEIKDRESGVSQGEKTKIKSLLDLMLEASSQDEGLTDQDLREEIDTFMFGGHDTTSASMCWFLYCMASNPEHQERVWEELNEVFGDSDRDCTMEDLNELKYLDYCLKEVLRLYPSAPLIERICNEEVKIGENIIPAGCNILVLIYGLHRNPEVFPDPLTFNPERFFPEQSVGRHPFAYIPFSAGPRNCIGQRFALVEEKVVLTTLMRRFKFSVNPEWPKPVASYQVILKPLGGLRLNIARR